jgi:hypothetical protein
LEIFFSGKKDSVRLKSTEYLDYTKLLVEHQDAAYTQLLQTEHGGMPLSFPKWRNQPLTLKEMEHALCEFSKYQRIERALQKGNASTGQRLRKSRSHLDATTTCGLCRISTTNLVLCDTCNQGYCDECDDDTEKNGISWLCRRCVEFESFEWEE